MFQKKRRSQRRHQLVRHYFQRGLVVLALGGVGVLLYFALQSDAWEQLNQNISAVSDTTLGPNKTAEVAPEVVDPSEEDFQDFLDKSTPQRLILRSTELIDDENDDLLDRLSRQDKIIRIADALLRIENDPRSNSFGTLSKLKALHTRELIQFDHGLTTEQGIGELYEFAYRATGSNDQDVEDEAQMGKFFVRLVRSLILSEKSDTNALDSALSEFKQISQQRVQDADAAREIYDLLERIHARVPDTISRRFILEYGRVFKASPSGAIRELAENADQRIIESELEFEDVLGSLGVDKSDALDNLSKQLLVAVERPFISAQGYKRILQQIELLGWFGRYDVAIECAELVQRRLASREALLPIAREANLLGRTYRNAGTKFDFSLVRKFANDKPFNVRYPDSAVKGLLFFDAGTVDETTGAITHIMGIAGRYIQKQDFCLSLIMLDGGNNEEEKRDFSRVNKLLPVIDTGIVDVRTDAGQKFVEKYFLRSMPHLILLDRDGRIADVHVVSVDFERCFFEILRSRR